MNLKQQVEQLEREHARSEGCLGQLMDQLRQKFSCQTLEQAKKLLKKLEREEQETNAKYRKAFKEFERKWSEPLRQENPGFSSGAKSSKTTNQD